MNSTAFVALPVRPSLRQALAAALAAASLVLAACGGSADAPPPPEVGPVVGVAPTITQQPANLTVTTGQTASFTVAATGTAPLAYQWQRNGADIAGATATTYTTAATVLGDSGTTFRARVTNAFGNATSNNATLTVSASAPVLTITQQPANQTVVAGTSASFTVAATCSSGTLVVQWQRGQSPTPTFVDIAGATALTFSLSTVIGDSGAQFRANLSCSGQSGASSNAATLTVTAPGSVTLSLLPLVGLRDQAAIPSATGIDQDAADSFTFITGNQIKRLSTDLLSITPVAGQAFSGSADGAAAAASFNQPFGLTHDAAGVVYVADDGNHTIRRIALDGTVTTLAGTAGSSGTTDGTGAAARFNSPSGIALGPDGDLYVVERNSHLIRRVTTAGVVTTYAGSGSGYIDGAALTAKFNSPFGIAVAANGDVLIADTSNSRIRRIVRAGNGAGAVETLAGSGATTAASPDGVGTAAVIGNPRAIVVRGNVLTVRDTFGLLRQIDLTSKVVTTLTGSRALGEGYADGTTATARIRNIGVGLTGAPGGGFMLADDLAIRSVSAAGVVKTIASSRAQSTPAGTGVLAQIPFILAVNRLAAVTVAAGNVVVAEEDGQTVRRVTPAGVVTLAAGLIGSFGGTVDGIGSEAQFSGAGAAITSDSAGVVYTTDGFGSVRRIGTDNATTLIAGSGATFGALDGNGAAARFSVPQGLVVAPSGDIFVGDTGNAAIRRIDTAGNVTTYAGVLGASAQVDGPIATARFRNPSNLGRAPDGSLYVLDNSFIRKIAADGSSVSTVAAAGFQVTRMTVDSATGTIYYVDVSGLNMLPSGGVSSVLIQSTPGNVVLGGNPRLPAVTALSVLGPKQILIVSAAQLLVATLP